jgi:CheY-like chemotaxis protein
MPTKRVLVVDDEEPIRSLVSAFVRHLGHASQTAASGPEALRLLETSKFDVVVSDFSMPDMNGDQLVEEIRKRGLDVPTVFITGTELEGEVQQMVLYKPFSLSAFRDVLEAAFAKNSRRQ